jgi:hypothetical protein
MENHNENNESYIFTTNVNRSLSEILETPPCIYDESFNWIPPKEHGLNNSNCIIPRYYKTQPQQILDIEYYYIIKDDIKNLRPLNEYQMEYILKLDHEKKNELLDIFNKCIKLVSEFNFS